MYMHTITEENKMVFVANDKYWGKKPYIETVEIHFFDNERLKYESNCNLLLLTGSNVTRYMNKAGYISYKYIGRNYVCLVPNLRNDNVANDVNIRKALMHIIDFDKVINASVSGNGIKAAWPVMPGTRYTRESSHMYDRNLNKAVEYLERAGYIKQDDGYWYKVGDTQRKYPLTIPVNVLSVDTQMRLCAENIKKQVEETGIIVSINYLTETDFKTALTSNNFTFALLSYYIGSWPDIEPLFATDGAMNLSGYSNEELDDLLSGLFAKDSILDDMTRIKSILDYELPVMGLYIAQEAIVISEKIYGRDAEYKFWSPLDNFGNLHLFTEGVIEE
jgi:ABC-type transport system substrate-binding protein